VHARQGSSFPPQTSQTIAVDAFTFNFEQTTPNPSGIVAHMVRTALLLFALGGLASGASAAPDTAAGAKVFTDQKCSLCHSVAAKGNLKGPLDEVGGKLSADDIRAWITDAKAMTVKTGAPRKPEMKAYTLEKHDVDALVAYLSTLKKP
jgi:mono/diheme cytochrome c family protein